MTGCNMATKKAVKLVKCETCGKEVKSLKTHIRAAHGDLKQHSILGLRTQLADLTAKLADSETKIKELLASPAPTEAPAAAILSDVDKKAMFEDWVNNSLTYEAWQTVGEFKGWIDHEAPALVSDIQQDIPKPTVTKLVLNIRRQSHDQRFTGSKFTG